MKEIAKLKQLPPVYTGKWSSATDEEVQEELGKGTPYTYRFRVPKQRSFIIDDLIRGEVFLFANSKCKRYFHNRLRPAKLKWTAVYRKQQKKDIAAEAVKKRCRTTKKPYSRKVYCWCHIGSYPEENNGEARSP